MGRLTQRQPTGISVFALPDPQLSQSKADGAGHGQRRGCAAGAERDGDAMIDLFSLGLTHALMALAAWRLVRRVDLDRDDAVEQPRAAWGRRGDA